MVLHSQFSSCINFLCKSPYLKLDTHEPMDHGGPSHDAPSESDSEEKNSIGNHDGDLVNNSHLDTATVPLIQTVC